MIEILCFSFLVMLASTVVGVLVGIMILGLFRIYGRLPGKVALSLKMMTLGPPLVLAMVGLVVSLDSFIWMIFYYVFAGLLACFGGVLAYRDKGRDHSDRGVGLCLMIAAALPFIWIGSDALNTYFGPGTFSFSVQNYSAPEIVLKQVQVDDQVIFTGEHWFKCLQATSSCSMEHAGSLSVKADLSRWPRKIKLFIHDTKLQKEGWEEVSLPFSGNHSFYPFSIVYDSEGFRYDDQSYP
jgi:hypothetical protein